MTINRVPAIVTVTRQGLAPTLSGVSTTYLAGDGSYTVPAGSATQEQVITFSLTNSGTILTTGYKTAIYIPFNCTIIRSTLLSNDPASTVGNLVLDVVTGTVLPPTVSIVASAPPTLAGANSTQDTTLTGWTTGVTAGFVGVTVTTITTVLQGTLQLTVTVP